ncbi:nucleolar protein 14 isoform X2 [Procambarus clarkii]|uniref:nucleolar protein 14 isoform X2 n=1 Tax=Procambarus clarkii TaxID=6728 RepID=UPI001E673FCD|nr:nucleolar protein 14-like isoform X2 [Procambarus clarkii]
MGKKGKFKPKNTQDRRQLEGKQEKKLNPFEVHINRVKHDIVGRKSKDDRGLPGVARAKAVKKREKTLLQEYKLRNKSNVFIDRRIGENDSRMDPEKKIALRLAVEKKKQFSKKSLFNLNDNEELTHGGFSLNDSNLNDKMGISDEDDDDEMLDAQFVKEKHFGGGGFLSKREGQEVDDKDGKPKSRKDWIDEIIAESKKKKAESKKEKEEQYEAVNKLDAELQSFMTMMASHTLTDEDKDKAKKTCEFRDYDTIVKELGFDRSGKAKAVEKLKTPQELVKEERERLLALETDRVRRMRGEKNKGNVGLKSADDLDDGFAIDKDDRFHVSYRDGEMIAATVEADDLEEEDEDQDENNNSAEEEEEEEEEEEVEEEEEGKKVEQENDKKNRVHQEKDNKNNDKKDEDDKSTDDESDKYSDILEDSESDEDTDLPKEKEVKKVSIQKTAMMEAAKKEIPYTFEVPQDYDSFWALLENHSPKEVSLILERMISCNHPSLGGTNKEKCDDIYAYILQTLHVLSDPEGESPIPNVSPMIYVDSFIQHLFTITQVSPANSAKALLQVIEEKYEDCAHSKFKRYPMANTFVFLKIAGLLFPSSDFIHVIMTPVVIFLTHLLGRAKIVTKRDVTAALFSAHLLFEYISLSKRFIPELANLLNGLLFTAIGGQDKIHLPLNPPFRPVGAAASLLYLENAATKCKESKLTLSSINKEEEELTDDFKVNIVCKTMKLLNQLCKCWSQNPSIRAIMAPTTKLLQSLSLKNYPCWVNEASEELSRTIGSLPVQGCALVREESKPVSIKMYEPAIENIIEGVKKRHGTKDYLEKQKLLHKLKREKKGARREIQRDTAFLARQQLMETIQSDAERKRKLGQIMGGLQMQEGEFKKMKKNK